MKPLEATVAVLATNGYEQSELTEPVNKLREAGATVHIIAPDSGSIRGWKDGDWGDSVEVDRTITEAQARRRRIRRARAPRRRDEPGCAPHA